MDVRKTMDYSIFGQVSGNREINEANIRGIMASINKKNLTQIRPILVDENMRVVDGQHRLEACKRLGLPVYYQVMTDLVSEDVILLNNQKRWTTDDYINFFASKGIEDCVHLQRFSRESGLSCVSFLEIWNERSGTAWKALKKTGQCALPMDLMNAIMGLIPVMKELIDFLALKLGISVKPGSFLATTGFKVALLRFLVIPDISVDRLKSKVEMRAHTFRRGLGAEGYFLTIKEIYNYRSREGERMD